MISRCACLFIILVACQGAFTYEEEQGEFVGSLGENFDDTAYGVTSLASSPVSAAVHKVDNGQYAQLFDTVVSSSIDSIQSLTPRDNTFAPESFGFNPIASQSFFPLGKSAKLSAQQQQLQPHVAPNAQQARPLRFDIRTVHDANYKVYKPEDDENEDILAKLKKNPSVAAYFQPRVTEVEVAHPFDYRKEDLVENREDQNNYKSNPYITGPARIRRYAGGRTRGKQRKNIEDDDDGYDYKAEYISRPKAFDSSPYSSYKEEKDPNKQYEYPYKYDSGYDHKEYERIKQLSEKQAAEIKENPGNCQEVKKDGMVCNICKDPKTGGNYESCSYVAEPKNNKYAYSKERKFDSNDEPDEPETNQKSEPKQSEKYQADKSEGSAPQRYSEEKPYSNYKREDNGDNSGEKYKGYYGHSSSPKTSESLRAASDEGSSENTESAQPYDYKKALPGFYTNNEPKKDVEHVLAEFKKKDRSACKKVQKNGMTCYQCIDDAGLKNEECMFVSESAPRQSHLAYQEVKAFTSKPATIEGGNEEGAESQTVSTSSPAVTASASFAETNPEYGKKLKRKKATSSTIATSATNLVPSIQQSHKVKRSEESQSEINSEINDKSNIAPPEEFAGAESRGAFWAETMPRYSAVLGVTLPEYMLSRSEHEISFDETVAGA